jgi:LuxR family maltose regulon positive regulatory protein
LVTAIAGLPEAIILVLDDNPRITGPRVHQLVSTLLQYQPRQMHLVIATRRDPALPLVRLRANQQMVEIRLDDLRFVDSQVKDYLEICLGREVSPETVSLLARRTEGWAVGLRLACLALRDQEDVPAFLESFQGTHRYVMDYLMDEVLLRQPQPIQSFLLRTSILDRFCAPLCEVILREGTVDSPAGLPGPSAGEILAELEQANLFLLALDQQGDWFRYHHLFQGLLRHRLRKQLAEHELATLHRTAGNWLGENGYTKEALDHLLAANDMAAAAALVARQRYALLNGAQWQQLEHLLHRFSPAVVDQIPDLLMLKTWLVYHHGNWSELPAAIQQLDQLLLRAALPPEKIDHLLGEISALRGLLAYVAADPETAIAFAHKSIQATPPELWIVRILARLCLGAALQMTGNLKAAYEAIYRGYAEEQVDSDAFKATLLVTACTVHWIAADLQGLRQAAAQCKALSLQARMTQMQRWAHNFLGCVAYHRNDLGEAESHFVEVVQQPYLSYGECYVDSACGLALTYQAQGRADEANSIADVALQFLSLIHI